ncbi:LLM class flavin-dependent oxidoreductase [Streptomyces sp. SBR177]
MPHPALHLAVEIDGDGAHPAAWRRAAHEPGALLTPRRTARVAAVAENSGFTLVTLDDGILPPGPAASGGPAGRIGAVERAAYIAASTSVLGVAPVVATTYAEPFHVSTRIASLDHVSVGRAGWVLAVEDAPEAARAWGRPAVEGAAALRREAVDGLTVSRDLWDSWEDDAVVRSVATSRYLDGSRLHYVDFVGETYRVKGPAIVPRPPQGRPVVLAPAGLVPPELVDVALVDGPSPRCSGGRPPPRAPRWPSPSWRWRSTPRRRPPPSGSPTWSATRPGTRRRAGRRSGCATPAPPPAWWRSWRS